MMRNGISRPPDRTEGTCGAATTSPPAVIACSFHRMYRALKARRTAVEDQHLCHFDVIPLRALARQSQNLQNRRHRNLLPARRDRSPGTLPPEQAPDLGSQVFLGEGLSQERGTDLQKPALKDLRGKPRHIEDGLAGPTLLHLAAQLASVHPRHLDIGEHQMDSTGMLLDRGDRLSAVGGFECLVTGPRQHSTRESAHCLFIVHHQDGIPTRWAFGWGSASRRSFRHYHGAKVPPGEFRPQVRFSVGGRRCSFPCRSLPFAVIPNSRTSWRKLLPGCSVSSCPELLDHLAAEEHVVQLYGQDDRLLTRNVGRYLEEGLKRGDGLLVIGTPEHRSSFVRYLSGARYSKAVIEGRLVFLDAAVTLRRFMVDGMPDAALFYAVV